jgi:subtilisin family serine protease
MILPVKVGSVDGSPLSAIAAGIVWAVDNGAHIINLSLGSDFPSDALHDAVNYAYANDIPVVAAAGNEADAISYPAAYPETISVGASTSWGTLTSFTSRSNRVDLVAPGTGILAPWWGEVEGDTWASVSGTSLARWRCYARLTRR